MAETLRITEIFYSIQGESTWTGLPCVFVRLTGCHLRCRYCDTAYAFKQGDSQHISDIVAEVCSYPCNLVQITGGEPLLQPRVYELIEQLCAMKKTVLIETSGAVDLSAMRRNGKVVLIMDIKTPGSGESERTVWSNINALTADDEVKFVITDREDFDWALDVIESHRLGERVKAILLSAVHEQAIPADGEIEGCEGLPMRHLAEWMLEASARMPANVRLQTQLHKLIWDPQTRGV